MEMVREKEKVTVERRTRSDQRRQIKRSAHVDGDRARARFAAGMGRDTVEEEGGYCLYTMTHLNRSRIMLFAASALSRFTNRKDYCSTISPSSIQESPVGAWRDRLVCRRKRRERMRQSGRTR